jgi:hypothetical protein
MISKSNPEERQSEVALVLSISKALDFCIGCPSTVRRSFDQVGFMEHKAVDREYALNFHQGRVREPVEFPERSVKGLVMRISET